MTPSVEEVIDGLIRKRYQEQQQLCLAAVHGDIVRAGSEEGVLAPAPSLKEACQNQSEDAP
ncbi:hypothetical protein ABIB49_003520 [Arthrobacter sp. UYCu512]